MDEREKAIMTERTCMHCGWRFTPRVTNPKKCPNVKCQRQHPIGAPTNTKGV